MIRDPKTRKKKDDDEDFNPDDYYDERVDDDYIPINENENENEEIIEVEKDILDTPPPKLPKKRREKTTTTYDYPTVYQYNQFQPDNSLEVISKINF